jgi:hypothetical protein
VSLFADQRIVVVVVVVVVVVGGGGGGGGGIVVVSQFLFWEDNCPLRDVFHSEKRGVLKGREHRERVRPEKVRSLKWE